MRTLLASAHLVGLAMQRSYDDDKVRVEQAALAAQVEQAERDRRAHALPAGADEPLSNSQPKFAALVELCTPRLERTVRQALGAMHPRIAVEDVVQQVWICVAKRLRDYRPGPSGCWSWLGTIAKNQARNAIRNATTAGRGGVANPRSADESQVERQAMDTATSVFSRTSGKEQLARLTTGLRRCLPELLKDNPDHAEVIARRHFGLDARSAIEALESGAPLLQLLPQKQEEFRQVAEDMAAAGSEPRTDRACNELYRRAMVSLGRWLLRAGAAPDGFA